MKIKKYYRLLLFAFLFTCDVLSSHAFTDEYLVNFTIEDGLPSNETYFAYEDKLGYIWIGTDRGLCRYDGYDFTVFTTSNSKITDNTIFKVYEAPNGELWFTCYNGTIFIYNFHSQDFRPFEHNKRLIQEHHWSSYIHFANDVVQIYLTFENNYYYQYNLISKEIAIQFWEVDSLVQINNQGLKIYQCSEFRCGFLIKFPGIKGLKFIKGEFDSSRSQYLIPVGKKLYTLYGNGVVSYTEFSTDINCTLKINDLIYVGTKEYLYVRDGLTSTKIKAIGATDVMFGLNRLVVTSEKNGVLLFLSAEFKQKLLAKDIVTKVMVDHNRLVIGTVEGIVGVTDLTQPEGVHWLNVEEKYINTRSVTSLKVHNDWIFPSGNVKYALPPSYQTGLINNLNQKINLQLPGGQILSCGDYYGYFITYQDDIVHIDAITTRVVDVLLQGERCILISSKGIWELEVDKPQSPSLVYEYSKSNERPTSLCVTSSGELIFSTNYGLYLVRLDDKRHVVARAKISGIMPNTLYLENDSTLWVGSNNGVHVVLIDKDLRKSRVLYSLNQDDGLPSNVINCIAVWKSKLCLGTDKGLFLLDKSRIPYQTSLPKLNLESVRVSNFGSIGTSRNTYNYNQNDFRFKYVGISLTKPKEAFYRFRLIKDDDSTVHYQYTNDVTTEFLNLAPGKYLFELSCRTKQNDWVEPIIYSFTINPHFINTWWFRGTIGTFAFFTLLGFIGWGIEEEKKIKSQEALLQKYELGFKESELMEHRNQMNPHFIFNALNSIQAFILENEIMTAADYLQKFSKLIRGTLNFSKQPLHTVEEIIKFLEAYLHIESLRFSDRFKFTLHADEEVRQSQYKIPPLLIQPIIENSIKHAFPGSDEGRIRVLFEQVENGIYVEVEDNGIGIYSDNKKWKLDHKSIGKDVVQQRLEGMNKQGYETSITFKDLSRVSAEKHGTLVQLLIKTKTHD